MAIEREVVRDIKKYDPKFIGPFSFRQFFCLALGATASFGVSYVLYSFNFIETFIAFMIAAVYAPFILVGFARPYDLPFEKFFISFVKDSFLTPTNRKYETKITGLDEAIKEVNKENAEASAKSKGKKSKVEKTKPVKESKLPEEYQSIDYKLKRK